MVVDCDEVVNPNPTFVSSNLVSRAVSEEDGGTQLGLYNEEECEEDMMYIFIVLCMCC